MSLRNGKHRASGKNFSYAFSVGEKKPKKHKNAETFAGFQIRSF